MRQLTALDQQFLALEDSRHHGHGGGLAILDPSTAPGGELTVLDIQRLVAERLPLVPPFRWRLAEVPFDLDYGPDIWMLVEWLGEALEELRADTREAERENVARAREDA
ncbi:MAG: wax ester/triacylglycerol synthase domain-containing protein [Solirubrobacteraceae bacterium]